MQECLGKDGKIFTKCTLGSPEFAKIEGKILLDSMEGLRQKLTQKEAKALMMFSFKGVDYCGHYLGQESLECHETMAQVDAEIGKIVEKMNELVGDDFVAVVTADHGVAPLPIFSKGKVQVDKELVNKLNQKFKGEFAPIKWVLNSAVQINREELAANGYRVEDVATFLKDYKVEGEKFFKRVLTTKDFLTGSDQLLSRMENPKHNK
jgi:hypothetical protein